MRYFVSMPSGTPVFEEMKLKALLAIIALFLGIIALRPFFDPSQKVLAEARFDHVYVAASSYLRNGRPGLLLMDRRNGNVWYLPTASDKGPGIGDPEFLLRVPLEKLDETPAVK
jgi:hypothetical protein